MRTIDTYDFAWFVKRVIEEYNDHPNDASGPHALAEISHELDRLEKLDDEDGSDPWGDGRPK